MVVEPGDDGAVVLHPVVVALRRGAVDVIAETILAEEGGEGARPGDVVRLVEVEDDRDTVEDVDAVKNRWGGGDGLDADGVGKPRLSVGVAVGRHGGRGGGARGGDEGGAAEV